MELNNIYLGDAYKLIKEIPDKSVDLVYIDIPYLMGHGGTSDTELGNRITRKQSELGNEAALKALKQKLVEYKEKMDNAKDKSEYEKWHCLHSNTLNNINLKKANIVNGIDYSILDELVRVMRYIYIYIYGAVKNKY